MHAFPSVVAAGLAFWLTGAVLGAVSFTVGSANHQQTRLLFSDDFENGTHRWTIFDSTNIRVVASGDAARGNVLELAANGALTRAVIRGSRQWRRVVVEGEMMFPDPGQSYLGFIWGHAVNGERLSYANMYVKGNDSYIQVNPHWDHNPIREMYPEYSADLEGSARIRLGEWSRFRVEVSDGVAHFYVGDAARPQMAFEHFASEPAGDIGFRPRVTGARVWIDNIRVRAIERFSAEAPRLVRQYQSDRLVTAWDVHGPHDRAVESLELGRDHGARSRDWRAFPADDRGAVIAAKVLDYLGPRTTAYFRTRISVDTAQSVTLRLASLYPVAMWVNGSFIGHGPRVETAWYDIASDSTRPKLDVRLRLRPGENVVVMRLRGGQYASGGFYAALIR